MADFEGDIRAIVNTGSEEVLDGLSDAWREFKEHQDESESDPVVLLVIGGGRHWMMRTMHPGDDRDRFHEVALADIAKHVLLEELGAGPDLDDDD